MKNWKEEAVENNVTVTEMVNPKITEEPKRFYRNSYFSNIETI
jgi:hypothetical protein